MTRLTETIIHLPVANNHGKYCPEAHEMLLNHLIASFGGATVSDAIGYDRYAPDGHEPIKVYRVATDNSLRAREDIYYAALGACLDMAQHGVYVLWGDGTVQFVGDPSDTIGAPSSGHEGQTTAGTIERAMAEHAGKWHAQSDFDKDQSVREHHTKALATHGERVEARQKANSPW